MIQNILYYFVLIVIIYLEVVLKYESIFIILIDSSLIINIRFIVKMSNIIITFLHRLLFVDVNPHYHSVLCLRSPESRPPSSAR
jgi:hypothetical protein